MGTRTHIRRILRIKHMFIPLVAVLLTLLTIREMFRSAQEITQLKREEQVIELVKQISLQSKKCVQLTAETSLNDDFENCLVILSQLKSLQVQQPYVDVYRLTYRYLTLVNLPETNEYHQKLAIINGELPVGSEKWNREQSLAWIRKQHQGLLLKSTKN